MNTPTNKTGIIPVLLKGNSNLNGNGYNHHAHDLGMQHYTR